jgi:hypothetical protein
VGDTAGVFSGLMPGAEKDGEDLWTVMFLMELRTLLLLSLVLLLLLLLLLLFIDCVAIVTRVGHMKFCMVIFRKYVYKLQGNVGRCEISDSFAQKCINSSYHYQFMVLAN